MTRLSRRDLIAATSASLALLALPRPAAAVPAVPDGRIVYDVYRNGSRIGRHTIRIARRGDTLVARNEIAIAVSVLGITAFRYEHSSREVWDALGILEIASRTNDDGTEDHLRAQRSDGRLVVTASGGDRTVDRSLPTTSLWHPNTVKARRLLDIQDGVLTDIMPTPLGRERREVPALGRTPCHHYTLGDASQREIWYDDQNRLVAATFVSKQDGSRINAEAVSVEDI